MRNVLLIIAMAMIGCSSSDDTTTQDPLPQCSCETVAIKEDDGRILTRQLKLCQLGSDWQFDFSMRDFSLPVVLNKTYEEVDAKQLTQGCDGYVVR